MSAFAGQKNEKFICETPIKFNYFEKAYVSQSNFHGPYYNDKLSTFFKEERPCSKVTPDAQEKEGVTFLSRIPCMQTGKLSYRIGHKVL